MLSSQNKCICPSCSGLSERTRETFIKNSALILIIQLCRFSNQGRQLIKDENFLSCTQSEWNKDLAVPKTVEDEVSFTNKYCVIASSNHSSTLYMGSLLGFYQRLTIFFLVLLQCQQSYIIHPFFTAKFKCSPRSTKTFHGFARGIVISDIVFGCDDPKYNPSPERELNLLTKYAQALRPCSSLFQRNNARRLVHAWSCLWVVTSSQITLVHPTLNFGKAEC